MVTNNMEVMASQLSKVIEMLDVLHAKTDRVVAGTRRGGGSRRSSGASAASNVSSERMDTSGEVEEDNEDEEPTGSQEDRDVYNNIVSNFHDVLFAQYLTCECRIDINFCHCDLLMQQLGIEENDATAYLTQTAKCRKEAMDFKDHLLTIALPTGSQEESSEHALKGLLERVTAAFWVKVYVGLGKHHPKNAGKKTGGSGRTKEKGKKAVQTASASQRTIVEDIPSRDNVDEDELDAAAENVGGFEFITNNLSIRVSPARQPVRQRMHAGSIFTSQGDKGKGVLLMSPTPAGGSGKKLKRTSGERGSASAGEGQKRPTRRSARGQSGVLEDDDIEDTDIDEAVDDRDDEDDGRVE